MAEFSWARASRHAGLLGAAFSLAAFGLSLFTFYFTFLQGPDISAYTPRLLSVGGSDRHRYTFFTPVTVINDGGGSAVVERIQLRVAHLSDATGRLYDAETRLNNYQPTGAFAAVPVNAESSITNDYQFFPLDRQADIFFQKPGNYRITLLVWLRGENAPYESASYTHITQADIDSLKRTQYSSVIETVSKFSALEDTKGYLRLY